MSAIKKFFALCALIVSCAPLQAAPLSFIEVEKPSPDVPYKNEIEYEETVMVTYVELHGGFYGLVNQSGEKLYPLNLPAVYETDGTEIYIKYREADTITTVNWGKPIIIEIISN